MQTGDRVEVYWAETGCWFAATTADASAEDCQTGFSVIYDELVDGQRVRENHVSNDRLRPLLVPPLLTVVEADSLLENPVGSPARHAEGESLSAQSPPAAVSVGSIMRSFISELGVFMAEGRVETDQWFSRKPLAERRSLLRIASSVAATAADGPGSLILRFLADVILASPSYGIIDKKAFAARFIDLSVAGLSDSDAAKGSKRGKGVGLLPVSEACSLLHSELFEDSVRGRSVPLGDLEIALRAGVLLLDASLAHAGGGEMSADDAPAVLSEDVMGAIMQVGSQCIALMEFVAKLPSTASAVAKVGEQEIEPTADIDEGDGDFSANKAQQKPKRGSKKSGARTEAHRQAFCGSAAFLIQEMGRQWFGPLRSLSAKLVALLLRRGAVRYFTGSDRLAITASKFATDVIALDPLHNETARLILDISASEGMEGLKNLLDQMHESALGLLKIAYTDNQLIRSTLLSDLLPQLHEAYVSSPCAPPSSAQGKYARSSQGQFHIEGPPIPNVLIAVMTLMQAAVLIAPDAAGSTHELGTHGRTAISKSKGIIGIDNGQNAEEMAFKYGSKQISAFLASLMKRCFSSGSTRTAAAGTDPQQYRMLTSRLLAEFLRLQEHPQCPVASIVVGLLVRKCASDLSLHCNLVNHKDSDDELGVCKNISYTSFLLDLIGMMMGNMSYLCKKTHDEQLYSDNKALPSDVLNALKEMYGLTAVDAIPVTDNTNIKYLHEIMEKVRNQKMCGEISSGFEISPSRNRQNKRRKTAKIENDVEGISDINIISPDDNDMVCPASALALLVDVTSAALDITTQRVPAYCSSDTSSMKAEMVDNVSGSTDLPSIWKILSLCGLDSRIMSCLGFSEKSSHDGISQRDVEAEFVCDHLMHIEYQHLANRYESEEATLIGESYFSSCVASDTVSLYLQLQLRTMRGSSVVNADVSTSDSFSQRSDNVPRGLISLVQKKVVDHNRLLYTLCNGDSPHCFKQRSQKEQLFQEYNWRSRYSMWWTRRCYRRMLVSRYLSDNFEKLLHLLCVALAQQQSPQLRAKVLKLFAVIMKIDAELFGIPNIRVAVCERFNDTSIMVREEAIKLVGINILKDDKATRQGIESNFYLEEKDDTLTWYLDGLLVRLRDKGVSVRKTVVNLLTAILFHHPDHVRYSQICQCLLEVAAIPTEEASVKEIIRGALHRVWFSSPVTTTFDAALKNEVAPALIKIQPNNFPGSPATHNGSKDEFSSKDPASSTLAKTKDTPLFRLTNYSDIAALQIVDVVYRSGNDTAWLVSMLRDVLHGSGQTALKPVEEKEEVKNRRSEARLTCERLLVSLREALLCTEEGNAATIDRLIGLRRAGSAHIVAIITAMSAFFEAHPPFLMPILDSLLPYLKLSNRDDYNGINAESTQEEVKTAAASSTLSPAQHNTVCSLILRMIADASPSEGHALLSKAEDLSQDLWRICLSGTAENVNTATRCLACLAQYVTGDLSMIEQLSKKCFDAIVGIAKQQDAPNKKHMGLLQRSIIVLGAICEQTISIHDTIMKKSCKDKEIEHSDVLSHIGSQDAAQSQPIDAAAHVLLEERVAKVNILSVNTITKSCFEAICGSTYTAIRFLLSSIIPPDESVHKRAAQALCSVFVGCSRLMILAQSENILQRLWSDEFSAPVHEIFLLSLGRMMMVEEKRLESISADEMMKRSGLPAANLGYINKIKGDRLSGGVNSLGEEVAASDGDSTVSGSVLQQHLEELSFFLGHNDAALRIASVNLIGTLLRQGMICPLDVMAQLVGLQGDANDAVQMRSLSIIQLEDIKHANFLDNRLCDGVELITYLQKRSCHRTWATVNNSANNFPVSLMGTLYISCFRSHKKRRTDFLTSLLRRCDTHCNITESLKYDSALESEKILKDFGNSPSSIGSSPSSGGIRRRGGLDSNRYPPNINSTEAKVEFLATTLAYIPFAVQDEVLLIISWLNRNTTVQTELFLKRFRDILMTRGAIIRQEGAMQGPMEGSALSFKRNAEHSSMDKIISSVGNPDGCVLDDTLLFDEEAFQCYIQCNVTTMKLDSALELYGAEARCRERLILVKHFLKYAYNLSSTLCVAYASEGKVVDKSRRPKKRPAKLKIKNSEISDHDADDVKEIVDMLPQVANDESGSTTVKLGVGWETSLIVSEHGVNHPFTALLPPVGGDSECYVNAGNFPSGKKQVNIQSPVKRRLDNWIDADHVTLSGTVANVDYTRQLIRKAIKDFNRLLTLHFNGFEHHAQKSSPGKKRMKRIVETDDETSGKIHRKTKRRRLSMKASDISDDEDFCENNDDNDEYVP